MAEISHRFVIIMFLRKFFQKTIYRPVFGHYNIQNLIKIRRVILNQKMRQLMARHLFRADEGFFYQQSV